MHFKEAGYQVFPKCFTPEEVALASETVEQLCRTLRPGDPLWENHVTPLSVLSENRNPGIDDPALLAKTPFIFGSLPVLAPIFARMITSEVLWAAACEVLESDRVVYHYANATRKPASIGPNMSWHQDYPNGFISPRKSDFFRALIPLEGMDEENGCTQVIPGTHCLSDAEAMEAREKKIRNYDVEKAVPLNLAPGDMAAIHAKVVHGGGANRSHRERNLMIVQFGIQTDDFLWKHDDEAYTCLTRDEILKSLGKS